tara:strand:+ start:317 stop:892 length:576 start_codon:yes stop_codon:yes gene_type:complete
MTEEKKKKTSKAAWGCLTIIILFFVLMYFMYDALLSTKFKENTRELIDGSPDRYLSTTNLSFPNDAKIIHISTMKGGPNFSSDLIFLVTNLDKFIENVKQRYEFKDLKMNYPKIEGGKDYDIMFSDLCGNLLDDKDLQPKNPDNLRNFCGNREIMIAQINNEVEETGDGSVSVIVILPNEKLVWVNDSGWF